ncbi:peroxiredoxin [Nitratireductor basaltis]|uniref:Glutathione-dependent peroxiredoxin n=1 Tax=Nitratireductor basaltis TaxID=472175 RepID=A0A084UCR1_9HYPH|nr:peroxiredoxin [Nitratireductor basaltis]KFB10747.1 Redoxin [Nitratireductor basaltis]
MTIAVGERLPEGSLKKASPEGAEDVQVKDFFAGRKVVLFGVPGAFTPTCSTNHLPGFVENYDNILERGVDEIAVLSVNDHHVMGAWARFTGAEEKITFLADGNGAFTKALGLEADLSVAGLGVRSSRFSMLVEDGVVKELNVEDSPGKAEKSGAAKILEQI